MGGYNTSAEIVDQILEQQGKDTVQREDQKVLFFVGLVQLTGKNNSGKPDVLVFQKENFRATIQPSNISNSVLALIGHN